MMQYPIWYLSEDFSRFLLLQGDVQEDYFFESFEESSDAYPIETADNDYFFYENAEYYTFSLHEHITSIQQYISRNSAITFSQALFDSIAKNGKKESAIYKKAHLDRRLFSKLRNDEHYRPSRTTAIALVIALELTLKEASAFLEKAGYSLSHSSPWDMIIEYFISQRIYSILAINEALHYFHLPLLTV